MFSLYNHLPETKINKCLRTLSFNGKIKSKKKEIKILLQFPIPQYSDTDLPTGMFLKFRNSTMCRIKQSSLKTNKQTNKKHFSSSANLPVTKPDFTPPSLFANRSITTLITKFTCCYFAKTLSNLVTLILQWLQA